VSENQAGDLVDDEILDCAALTKLTATATPGPWTADVWIETDGNGWRATGPHHEAGAHDHGSEPGCPDEQIARADAAFIAAARTAVPELLAEVARLRAVLVAQDARDVATLTTERDAAIARVAELESESGELHAELKAVVDYAVDIIGMPINYTIGRDAASRCIREMHREVHRQAAQAVRSMETAALDAVYYLEHSTARHTAERIAAWLDSGPELDSPGLQAAARAIRAGAWRKEESK